MKSTMKIFFICCLLIVSANSALAQSGTFSLSAAQLEYLNPPAYSEGYYDHYATIQVPRDVPLKITYSNNTNNGLYLYDQGSYITGQTTITNGSFTYISKTGYIDIISEWLWSYFPFADEEFNMYSISWALDENYSVSSNSWTSNNATILGKLGIGSYYTSSSAKLSITNTSENYSLFSNTTKNTSSSIYGVYSSTNNSTGNVYGLYSTVTGVTGKKWSGYFNGGDVAILGGNTGIGVNNPQGILQVRGTYDNSWIYFTSNAGMNTTKYKPKVNYGLAFNWNYSGGDGESIINYSGTPGSSRLDFTSFDGTNLKTEMTLKGGSLGIGTISPDEKLTVNGNIHAKGVLIDMTGPLADFVFDDDYPLMPLNKVKKFITINKHLPGIPSAKEVSQKSLDVGQMQNLLLQKIEELTLYILEQQKQINELQSEIKTLR